MRPKALVPLAVLLAALASAVAAAPDVAAAAGYPYTLRVEDPAGDQQGVSALGPPAPGTPGDANPENDILAFEASNDASAAVFRYTMAAMDGFTVPGPVSLTVQLTGPADEDWEATITYGDGGTNPAVADLDPSAGDDDSLVPGATAGVDAAAGMVYLFVDLAQAGLAIGDALQVDAVNSGKGVSVPGAVTVSNDNRDVVDVTDVSYTLADPSSGGEAPLRVFKTAQGTRLNESFAAAANATVQYNVTVPFAAGSIAVAAQVDAGSVQVTLLDAGNGTVADLSADGSGNQSKAFQGAQPGRWTVRLNFTGFAGSLEVTLSPPPAATTASSTSGAPASNTGSGNDNRTGSFPLREVEKTPGLGVPLLLAATAAAAVLVRRRTR